MAETSVSLWLPVGRANFYSVTANGWLIGPPSGAGLICSSKKLAIPGYVPVLQCSVLRRLLEVLPLSFGYEREGECTTAAIEDGLAERSRPVSITMHLVNLATGRHGETDPRWRANHLLAQAGVDQVDMRADEHGNYTFVARSSGAGTAAIQEALRVHVGEVFGGPFDVRRLEPQRWKDLREGAAAVRRYNGLAETPQPGSDRDPTLDVHGSPLGALTFFQLNTMLEGICNLTLSPAVFFERYGFMKEYLAQGDGAIKVFRTVGEFVDVILTDADGRQIPGQIDALRHFLAVTSRETLQKVKWSVESVRRNLLSEMMSVLHRQSRLVQLDLAAIKRERSPELASDANETQLRGYVTLVAAKLPIISNVNEVARLAADHLQAPVRRPESIASAGELGVELEHWFLLLTGLKDNVRSLERAVEQAWMERVLYEQQQSRSEQEAISEIERSRFGRGVGFTIRRSAYDSVNLIFTILSVLFVVATTKPDDIRRIFSGDANVRQLAMVLWPIAAVAVVLYLIVPAVSLGLRQRRDQDGTSDSYTYEFAFAFDEATEPELIEKHLLLPRRRERPKVTVPGRRLRRLSVTRLGGGRIERVSVDNSSIKLHTVLTFRARRWRYARFEVVHEILVSRVSDVPRYLLHQIRIFGDSPVALDHGVIGTLIDTIHELFGQPLASDGSIDDPLTLLRVFYPGGQAGDAELARPRRRRSLT
jgi:hypothetical protein